MSASRHSTRDVDASANTELMTGSGAITLRLYDPKWPDRDDMSATLSPAGLGTSTGERLFGVLALR